MLALNAIKPFKVSDMEKKRFYANVFHHYASNNDMRPTPTASRLKSLFANVRIFLYTVLQNRSDTDLAKTNKIMIIINVISPTMNILPFQSSLYPLGRTKLDSINEFHTIRSKKGLLQYILLLPSQSLSWER